MSFWNKLGKIILDRLTPSKPEEFIGIVEEITISSSEEEIAWRYYHVLYVDNKGSRCRRNYGNDAGSMKSQAALRAHLNVEAWLLGGPLPNRLNVDSEGREILLNFNIVNKPKAKPTSPKKEIPPTKTEGNLIHFPGNKTDE